VQTKRIIVVLNVLLASLALTGGVLAGTQMAKGEMTSGSLASSPLDARLAIISEETGLIAADTPISPDYQYDPSYGVYLCPQPAPQALAAPDPVARAQAQAVLATRGLLLIPESTNARVMAFDPATGDLIDADFIPSDPAHLVTPINAIFEPRSNTILVSDQVPMGGTLTYTLVITNHGPAAATMVILTDTLPAEVTYLSATPDQGTCNQAGGLVTCDLGDIASGGTVSVEIVVTAPPDPMTITNIAEVAALEFDLFPDDNTAILAILVKYYNLFLPIVSKP
jgi:uncharacterized repeat protein (TIGR01451 family)